MNAIIGLPPRQGYTNGIFLTEMLLPRKGHSPILGIRINRMPNFDTVRPATF